METCELRMKGDQLTGSLGALVHFWELLTILRNLGAVSRSTPPATYWTERRCQSGADWGHSVQCYFFFKTLNESRNPVHTDHYLSTCEGSDLALDCTL